jgi:hypothetical protein
MADDEKFKTHDRKRMTWRKLGLISINTSLRPVFLPRVRARAHASEKFENANERQFVLKPRCKFSESFCFEFALLPRFYVAVMGFIRVLLHSWQL